MSVDFNESEVRKALLKAWSPETAKEYTPHSPASGQCNVTAIVIQELFGGEILRTKLAGFVSHHYYNRINGKRVDLTDIQFDAPIRYTDEISDKAAAIEFVKDREYEKLKNELSSLLTA